MGFLVVSESGRLLGGRLLRVGMRRPDRRGAWGWVAWIGAAGRTTSRSRRPPRALVCARGGRRLQYPRERRGSSSWRACARQGLPGVRLSNRGVVTSGDGADRVGASGVDGAKSRRRRQAMRNRSSDARQQPCDGRNDVRHDFPDLLDDCRLHRAARPRSRRCLHGYMGKQRASARIAARGEAKRAPCAAVQRFGGGDVSAVKRAAVGPAGGAPGVARNGRNDGGSVSAARYRFGARNWPAVSGIVSALNLRANGGIVTTPRLSRHWRHPPPPSRSSRAAARRRRPRFPSELARAQMRIL